VSSATRNALVVVEYLYALGYGKFRVLKRTRQRVYFVLDETNRSVWFVRIADLQKVFGARHWKVYAASGAHLITEERYKQGREDAATRRALNVRRKRGANGVLELAPRAVAEYRRQMQKHHPDKGGDRKQFEQWRRRFQAARSGRRP
jgi:hypothetical protein